VPAITLLREIRAPQKVDLAAVLLNPQTGKLIKDIGPVGFTVNGLAWDPSPYPKS
jgi:hypothetical protein